MKLIQIDPVTWIDPKEIESITHEHREQPSHHDVTHITMKSGQWVEVKMLPVIFFSKLSTKIGAIQIPSICGDDLFYDSSEV